MCMKNWFVFCRRDIASPNATASGWLWVECTFVRFRHNFFFFSLSFFRLFVFSFALILHGINGKMHNGNLCNFSRSSQVHEHSLSWNWLAYGESYFLSLLLLLCVVLLRGEWVLPATKCSTAQSLWLGANPMSPNFIIIIYFLWILIRRSAFFICLRARSSHFVSTPMRCTVTRDHVQCDVGRVTSDSVVVATRKNCW